ncbi:MAG TPA: RNA degradosome polyphosphate kinase, partial [Candidatus Dorea intestinavium]|nr:RNA degradosome polyphosphate kinase [Candidatus Dorea intestinavium]
MDKELLLFTQNRELSWLRFNQRVLREAQDESVPLLERMKFVAIFTSNLDEFFMIRVGSLFDKHHAAPKTLDVCTN